MLKAIYRFFALVIVTLLEGLARITWLMLPLGFHMLMLQMREKVDRLPAINGYFSEDSTWSMIYDGVVLVNTNPGGLSKKIENVKLWFKRTRYRWLVGAVLTTLGLLIFIASRIH